MAAIASDVDVSVYSHVTTWVLTTADPVGDRVAYPNAPDKSVQFDGTFGTATVALEGSNKPDPTSADGADWFPLTDPQGNAISKTAAGGEAVIEAVRWVRPRLTTPGAGATINVYLFSRRNIG